MEKFKLPSLSVFLMGLLVLIISTAFWHSTKLAVEEYSVIAEGQIVDHAKNRSLEFSSRSSGPTIYDIKADLSAPFGSLDVLSLTFDDCLQALEIEGYGPIIREPNCDYGRPFLLDIPSLRIGSHFTLRAKLLNRGGIVKFKISDRPFSIRRHLPTYLGTFLALYLILKILLVKARLSLISVLIISAGVSLRICWYLFCDYQFFSHDLDGHVAYLNWVYENWSIPHTSEGFQFYHPPLYYFLVSTLFLPANLIYSTATLPSFAYFIGLLISLLTLWLAITILLYLIPTRRNVGVSLALAVICLTPSTIFSSVRINNDGLAHLLIFLCILFLIKWWRSPTGRLSLLVSTAGSLALLSKAIAIPLVVATPLIMLLRLRRYPTKVWGNLLSCVVVFTIFLLPYFYFRYHETGKISVVSNATSLSGSLKIPNRIENFVTFSISELIEQPFMNPFWDSTRREVLWESLYKSAFTGEEPLSTSARETVTISHLIGLIILLLSAYGLCKCSLKRVGIITVIASLTILSVILSRYLYPFGCTMNMRYFQLLIFSVAVFAALGLHSVPLNQELKRRAASILAIACLWYFQKIFIFILYI